MSSTGAMAQARAPAWDPAAEVAPIGAESGAGVVGVGLLEVLDLLEREFVASELATEISDSVVRASTVQTLDEAHLFRLEQVALNGAMGKHDLFVYFHVLEENLWWKRDVVVVEKRDDRSHPLVFGHLLSWHTFKSPHSLRFGRPRGDTVPTGITWSRITTNFMASRKYVYDSNSHRVLGRHVSGSRRILISGPTSRASTRCGLLYRQPRQPMYLTRRSGKKPCGRRTRPNSNAQRIVYRTTAAGMVLAAMAIAAAYSRGRIDSATAIVALLTIVVAMLWGQR